MNKQQLNRSLVTMLALAAFVVLYRWGTADYPTSLDSMYYWVAAKKILAGMPIDLIEHRTMRFGVVLPVALTQLIFGQSPYVVFIAPLFFSVTAALLIYQAGRMLSNEITGLVSALLFTIYPYMAYLGLHVLPSIFVATYAFAATVCLIIYVKQEGRSIPVLIAAAFLLFCAYEAKITALYLMPGFALIPLIYKKNIRHVIIFLGTVFILYLVETGLYIWLGGPKIGRLGVFSGHMAYTAWVKEYSLIGLILRWWEMGPYWLLLLSLFLVSAFHLFRRDRASHLFVLVIPTLIFLFIYTFAIRSAFPFTTLEPTFPRYLTIILPATLITVVHVLQSAIQRYLSPEALRNISTGALAMGLAVSCMLIYKGWAARATEPWNRLYSMSRYQKELNEKFDSGIPIISCGHKYVTTCLYLREPRWPVHEWTAIGRRCCIIIKDRKIWDDYDQEGVVYVESISHDLLTPMPKRLAVSLAAVLP